jgi:5'-nucleotidase
MVVRQNWKAGVLAAAAIILTGGTQAQAGSTITLLHNNDGESQLLNAGSGLEDYGGAARFVSLANATAAAAENPVIVSSGDNFLPGPEFNASLSDGVYYDARVLNAINYDAIALGNHDFDFGPTVLSEFINEVDSSIPYVSANLDFSGEPALQAQADAGRIVPSTIVEIGGGQRVGIVGATTTSLPTISSPRNVEVLPVAENVQAEIDKLTDQGVNKIVLISHLQGLNQDLALIPQLRGVDVAVAGGGDELLANADTKLIPGDEAVVAGPYPLIEAESEDGSVVQVRNADGSVVPVVTTTGSYQYLGALRVEFDDAGNVIAANGQPLIVVDQSIDAVDGVSADTAIVANVTDPVAEFVAELDQTVVANSEVGLNGVREDVRTKETNLGSLVADALLYQAQQLADEFDVDSPNVSLQNGGGIRNDSVIEAGEVTALDTFDILPFSNFVTVVEDVSAEEFLAVMENAVSQVENTSGRFAQIGGFSFTYDPEAEAGSRVIDITLDDGTVLISNGEIVDESATVDLSIADFLARGGDEYPLEDLDFTALGVTYQQALENYLVEGLDGQVLDEDYPEGGLGRITTAMFREEVGGGDGEPFVIPTPSAVLGGFVLMGLFSSRRRRQAD